MPCAATPHFVCAKCGKGFMRKHILERHAQIHNNSAEKFRCTFPGCMHSSLQKGNIKTHYISMHLRQRLYQCDIDGCSKSFYEDSTLIRHEKRIHGFYRKENKAYVANKRLLRKINIELELDAFHSIESSACTPQLCDTGNASCSPASTSSTPSPELYSANAFNLPLNKAPNIFPQHNDTWNQEATERHNLVQHPIADEFLQEMVPELFLHPEASQNSIFSHPYNSNFGFTCESSSMLQMPTLEGVAPMDYSFSQLQFQ